MNYTNMSIEELDDLYDNTSRELEHYKMINSPYKRSEQIKNSRKINELSELLVEIERALQLKVTVK